MLMKVKKIPGSAAQLKGFFPESYPTAPQKWMEISWVIFA